MPINIMESEINFAINLLTNSDSNEVIEDRRLKNWKRWLLNRKIMYKYLKSKTGRYSHDLVMNSCEKFRSRVETQSLIDTAATLQPLNSYNRNDFETVLNKMKSNYSYKFDQVIIPKLIQEEKSINLSKNQQFSWKKNKYLEKRMKELAPSIAKLQLNQMEIDQLAIKGIGISYSEKKKKIKILRIPVIIISSPEESEINQYNQTFDPDDIIILKIQDREIISGNFLLDNNQVCNPIEFNWFFNETQYNQRVEQKIVLENKGTFAITYRWYNDSVVESVSMASGHEKNKAKIFQFNKETNIILPGQIAIHSVWYNPPEEIVDIEHIEVLQLNTIPKVSSSPIIFNFYGHRIVPTILNCISDFSILDDQSIYKDIQLSVYEFIEQIIFDIFNDI